MGLLGIGIYYASGLVTELEKGLAGRDGTFARETPCHWLGVNDIISKLFDREARVYVVDPISEPATIRTPFQESDIDQLDLLFKRQRVQDGLL